MALRRSRAAWPTEAPLLASRNAWATAPARVDTKRASRTD
eukprot:CAMPEP_0118908652 /NCGR_PEP_ID=MMETSP1166-20130328/11573_1 /TAXON_ID=1104430 /ORGANISM="Chrysoreinhardia sp, Strain CCMP3193" /LENGTH=39 /DNA_ID= /DNA_START= /DNA_END= /DNA_ORIENTATION=